VMHGLGRSDSAIVARKSANKTGKPVAERMEPRAEAEGKASQQSTCRAQNRISVYQALERIRQAARARKKEQFTLTSASCQHRSASAGIFRPQTKSRAGCGWAHMERLRRRLGG